MNDLVYAAVARGRVVYVGRTDNLRRRMQQHRRERTGPHKRYPDAEWVVVRDGLTEDEAITIETTLIRTTRPECNGSVPELTVWRRLRGLCGSWWRRSVQMVRRVLELVGAAVVVAGAMWWWLG